MVVKRMMALQQKTSLNPTRGPRVALRGRVTCPCPLSGPVVLGEQIRECRQGRRPAACVCPVCLCLCWVLEAEGGRLSGDDCGCQLGSLPVFPGHRGKGNTAVNRAGAASPSAGARCTGSCPALLRVRSREKHL